MFQVESGYKRKEFVGRVFLSHITRGLSFPGAESHIWGVLLVHKKVPLTQCGKFLHFLVCILWWLCLWVEENLEISGNLYSLNGWDVSLFSGLNLHSLVGRTAGNHVISVCSKSPASAASASRISVPWLGILGSYFVVHTLSLRCSPLRDPGLQKFYLQPGNLFIICYRWPVWFFQLSFFLLHFSHTHSHLQLAVFPVPSHHWGLILIVRFWWQGAGGTGRGESEQANLSERENESPSVLPALPCLIINVPPLILYTYELNVK